MEQNIKEKKKIDYTKGKIYTIRSYKTDKIYIGSTTQSLAKRLYEHRQQFALYLHYKGWDNHPKQISKINSQYILIYDDHYIELLENYSCKSKEELEKREGELMRDNITKVVNNNILGGKTENDAERLLKVKNQQSAKREAKREVSRKARQTLLKINEKTMLDALEEEFNNI